MSFHDGDRWKRHSAETASRPGNLDRQLVALTNTSFKVPASHIATKCGPSGYNRTRHVHPSAARACPN